MGCVKGPATLGIDNISLMQACVNRGSVMDLLPLTDDGYCGLKVAKKKEGEKKGSPSRVEEGGRLWHGHRFSS